MVKSLLWLYYTDPLPYLNYLYSLILFLCFKELGASIACFLSGALTESVLTYLGKGSSKIGLFHSAVNTPPY